MSRWRNRQTPAVESRSFAGSRPALDTGRWWNLVDTPRSGRGASCMGVRVSPAHQFYSRGGIGRRGSLKTSVNMQVRFLPGVPRTRPDGDGSSLQNCDSRFNSLRVCHVGDAEEVEATVCKTVLTGFESRLSLHRRARSDGNAFWSRKPALWESPRMEVRLLRPPPLH
jgi:hypothetical protein